MEEFLPFIATRNLPLVNASKVSQIIDSNSQTMETVVSFTGPYTMTSFTTLKMIFSVIHTNFLLNIITSHAKCIFLLREKLLVLLKKNDFYRLRWLKISHESKSYNILKAISADISFSVAVIRLISAVQNVSRYSTPFTTFLHWEWCSHQNSVTVCHCPLSRACIQKMQFTSRATSKCEGCSHGLTSSLLEAQLH